MPPSDDFAIHRLTLRFKDPSLERAFSERQAASAVLYVRFLAALTAAFGAGFVLTAPWLFPEAEGFRRQAALALLPVILFLGGALGLSWSRNFARWLQPVALIGALVTSAALVALTTLLPVQILESYGYALPTIHVLNVYSIMKLRFWPATLAGLLTVGLYALAMLGASALPASDVGRHVTILAVANLFGTFVSYQLDRYLRREFVATCLLVRERERSERLLLNILPAAIAERLKASPEAIADGHGAVSVLFADIVGFTPLSARLSPGEVVRLLDDIFTRFDALAARHGLEKIKTIGDAYMAVAGLPASRPDHGPAAAVMALGMLEEISAVSAELGIELSLRIGLHSGPVVAGVIGRQKFTYDLWGDTVNTASRMESHGAPGRVHLSAQTRALLGDSFSVEPRGEIQVKGKGEMATFWLEAGRPGAWGP